MRIELECQCGEIKGHIKDVSSFNSTNLVCYCADCRAFAKFLEKEVVLDQNGGTQILQTTQSKIVFDKGEDKITGMRLSPKGACRFYSSCCKTPMANMGPGPKFPFVGIPFVLVKNKTELESKVPLTHKVLAKYSLNGKPKGAHDKISLGLTLKVARILGIAYLKDKNKASPFFKEGKLKFPLNVIPKEDKAKLY